MVVSDLLHGESFLFDLSLKDLANPFVPTCSLTSGECLRVPYQVFGFKYRNAQINLKGLEHGKV